MNTATENLMNDHIHIISLTELMMQMTLLPELNAEHVKEVIYLIRNFADGLHHAKEENLLFPALGAKGFSTVSGPVAVMLAEHVQGREYVKQMSEGIEQLAFNNEEATMKIKHNMRGYAHLLQQHIDKENNILFRMADGVLTGQEQEMLQNEFRKLDSGETSGTGTKKYIEGWND